MKQIDASIEKRKNALKKAMKQMTSLFLAVILLMTLLPLESAAADFSAVAGSDTVNIGIASDMHISRSDSASDKTLEALLRNCLQSFYSATAYNLDAVAFVGDITDNGYVDELETVRSIVDSELNSETLFTACMGNHEFYKYGWGVNVAENSGMKEEMQSDFTANLVVPIEDDISVSGVHILSVSPDNELDSYTARESFLREHIQAAAAEDATNPIIVIAHKPVKYTVMSSGSAPDGSYASLAADWSDSFLAFLKQYPQIIYFSGHAHDDLSNEEMIYQEDFTSVQDGVVCVDSASTGVLVSIDSNKVVTINRMNFTTGSCFEPAWTIDIPKVIESKDNFAYREINSIKNLNLTVGQDASELYVNWYNSTFQTGKVQYAKATNMVNGVLSDASEVTALGSGEAYGSDYYYSHAMLSNLEAGTEYVYRVGNENGWSDYDSFTTPDTSSDLSFLFAADAQIGCDDTDSDTAGWTATLNHAIDKFPNAQLLLHCGDQVEVASNSTQYDGFLSPSQLTFLPIATIAGNHDFNSRLYSQHFAYSNVDENTITKISGTYSGDYWFVRGSTLFMTLNSNVQDTQLHQNFMQQAILDAQDAGYSIKWKIVMFHHSIFSTAGHSTNEDIIERRESLPRVFSDLQIDLVLMGHDHTYCRTYMMDGTTPITDDGVQSSVTDPDPGLVLYITGGSASGSKYYDLIGEDYDYAAVTYQGETPSISNVDITEHTLTIATYNSADMTTATDSFTINKTQTAAEDTLKPYLFIPVENDIILDSTFYKLDGVSAIDNVDGDITGNIVVTGDVDTSKEGTYTLSYEITDSAGNIAAATRSISVKKEITSTSGKYFGIDIKSGEFQNESDSDVSYSAYTVTGDYTFETDSELNQTVLCGPDSGNLVIDGLNLEPLDNEFTIETYLKIPSTISSYDVFQFVGQNINLVGFPDNTYFGAGRSSSGDADVYVEENLPTDQWLHVICTAKEGEQELYVNGTEFAANSYEGLNITSTNDDELILGGTYSGRSGLLKFAYFRIYSGFVTESQVQSMYTDMQNSFLADYTAVDAAIAKIPSDLTAYTDESVSVLNAAVAAVERSKTLAEQEVVDGYAEAIASAINELAYKGDADYTAVYAAIAKIPSDLSVYTEDSVNLLNAAKDAVVAGKSSSEQALVDGYAAAIENAIQDLAYKEADYTAVDAAIAKIPADLSVFTEVSVTALNSAVAAVIRDKNITEQTAVDGYAAAIEAAIRALNNPDLYFGIDIANGKLENEIGSTVTDSDYVITGDTGGYAFETDAELHQTVLCGPEKENLVINELNLSPLENQFTVEAYVKIPSQLSESGLLTAYDVFQFDGQNVNLVGVQGGTYFGAGEYSDGDADIYTEQTLPTDQWIHVLCTAKEGEQTLYVNGERFLSDTFTGLNIARRDYDELVLGGITADRSGLIKFAYFRIYSTFTDDAVAQNMYGDMRDHFASADNTIVSAEITGVKAPVKGAVPTASLAETAEYKAAISWSPADASFAPDTVYTATITLTPKAGFTLEGVTADYFTVAGAAATNDADSGVITAVFPATAKLEEPPQLVVTEIQPDNADSDYYEFFEVYNTTSQDIDLTEQAIGISYYTSGSNVPVAYPANTVIPKKTAVVFWLKYQDGSVDNTSLTTDVFDNYYVISGSSTDTTTDNLDSDYEIVRGTGVTGLPDTGGFGIRLSDSLSNVISESYCPERTAKEDRPYEFRLSDDYNVVLLEDDVLPSPGKTALKQNVNTVYDETIASGIQYTEENISNYYDTGYKEHVNVLEIALSNSDTYVLASKAYDTVNAMDTIGNQAERETERGYQVVAGINADMYDMTTGMPISIQIRENRLIVSQSPYEEINAVRPALYLDSNNKAGINRLSTEGTVRVGSETSSITLFNRNQDVTDDIVIYTSDVATDHKLTHAYGYDTAAFALIEMNDFSGLYPGVEHTGTVKAICTVDGFEIPDGYIVLAGYGTRAAEIGAFSVGDNASFSFDYCVGDEKTVKNDIQNAVVMNTWLVKDGHANLEFEMTALSDYVRTVNSRTAIGVKSDGTLVAVTIDKPSTAYSDSVGVTMAQMAKYLRDIGCVDALNLDGGGSTEMIVRKAGKESLETVNVPSDGSSRMVTSALLFVTRAESTGNIKNVVVDQNVSLYKGSGYAFTCRFSDETGQAISASGQTVVWSTTFGTIDQNGTYTAPDTTGSGEVTATVNGVSGSCTVEVVDSFSSIEFTAGTNVVLDPSASKQFEFLAYSDTGSRVLVDLNLAAWSLSGDIGTVSASGLVTITAASGSGVLTAQIGAQTVSAVLTVGIKEQIIDDFETYPIEAYHLDGYGYGNVAQYAGSLGSSDMLHLSTDVVHSGNRSFQLDYDFSMWTRSSNGTLNLRPHWNTTVGSWTADMAAQMAATYTTDIYPKKLGLWVYGDNQAPWLRAILLAGDGSSKTINLTTDSDDVNWTGWKYIEADIPEGWELPISLKYVYSVETDKQKDDYSGTIYFDDLKFLYTDEVSDFSGPEYSGTSPSSDNIYRDAIDFSTIITDDLSGVDADSIVVKVNDAEKTDYTYDAATGKLSFMLGDLEDGDYTVYVAAYDGAGNLSVPWIEKTYHINTSPDVEAPVLTDVTPTSDVAVKIPTPRITFKLKDVRATVLTEDISVKLDSAELSVYYDESTGWGYAEPETDLSEGNHALTISAADPAGNTVTYTDSIDVKLIEQPADSENFSISILPDTQGNVYTERIFQRAEEEDSSLVLHVGDIVDSGTQQDYDAAADYAQIFTEKPLFVAAGNHEAFLDTLDIYYKEFGSPTFHFDYGSTMIIFLNSAYGQSITASDSTQYHYLEEVLAKNTKPNVIVVNHVITHDSFGTAHAMTEAEAEQFESILTDYKTNHPDVTVDVLFGHLHTLQSWETGGVNYIITGNAANKNYVTYDEGSFLGSGRITVENGEMSYAYSPFVTSVAIENDLISDGTLAITPYAKQQLELTGNFKESPSDYSVRLSDFDLVDIVWSSGDPTVATVDENGLVKALKSGVTTITAASGGKSSSITVTVSKGSLDQLDLYYGLDIKTGQLKNEEGCTVTNSSYGTSGTGAFAFEKDGELNQTVLCGPESGNLTIDGLNLKSLNNQVTVEAYLNISGTMSAYDVFQFDGQNVNLSGLPAGTYFGAGEHSGGDADVYTDKALPTDEWIHVICTAKEGKQVLYVNGEAFSSDSYTGLDLSRSDNDKLVLGGLFDGRSGLVKYAYLRVYSNFVDDALAQELYSEMTSSFAPNSAPTAKDTTAKVIAGNSITLAAAEIAGDTDGDTLTITAIGKEPDSAAATASLRDGAVIITGVAAGSTSITVTVSDGTDAVDITVPITVAAETAAYTMSMSTEQTGGAGCTRTVHIDGSENLSGRYVVVQFTEGTGTNAKVSVVLISVETADVTVSYQKSGTKIDVWLVDGMPALTNEDMEVQVYDHVSTDE